MVVRHVAVFDASRHSPSGDEEFESLRRDVRRVEELDTAWMTRTRPETTTGQPTSLVL